MSGEREDKREETAHLEWQDYLAIAIASLQTTLLPVVVMVIILLLAVLVLKR
jgi:hypothetical protein